MKALIKQHGIALLLFVTVLATAAATVTVKALNHASQNNQLVRDKITAAALAQAKDALIGRAVSDANRPGSLPCPDMVTNVSNNVPNDGIADLLQGNDCPSYIGRLPWKTLDLPDLRDGSGERLWYVLSRNFRDDNSAQPINSDLKGTLTVYASDGSTPMTPPGSEAVAVIFAPGAVLATQNRGNTKVNDATQYLEQFNCPGPNCRNNAVAAGPFIAGPILDASRNPLLNNKLLVIRARDIMPAIEKLVAKQLNNWLQTYYATNGYYPYPAKYNACDDENCQGDNTTCRGRIPILAASGTAAWSPPSWFVNNQWYRQIYYSVASTSLKSPASVTCLPTLTVGTGAVRAVFFMPGTPIGSITRPSIRLSDYLEDLENQDGWSGLGIANDLYVVPSSTTLDRDRLYSFP